MRGDLEQGIEGRDRGERQEKEEIRKEAGKG